MAVGAAVFKCGELAVSGRVGHASATTCVHVALLKLCLAQVNRRGKHVAAALGVIVGEGGI